MFLATMIAKTFFAFGLFWTSLFVFANTTDLSAQTLALAGLVFAVTNAAAGGYAVWRAAKHRADLADQVLIQGQVKELSGKLQWAEQQILIFRDQARRCEEQAERWEALYRQAIGATGNTKPLPPQLGGPP